MEDRKNVLAFLRLPPSVRQMVKTQFAVR
jgi:hypothetical protein